MILHTLGHAKGQLCFRNSKAKTMATTIIFLFALLGYIGVTTSMLARYADNRQLAKWAAPTMFAVVTLHVFLVWYVRFGFDPAKALSGGMVPAILLHLLYVILAVHAFGHTRNKLMGRLIYVGWGLVTLLGMPSPFVMPALSWMQIPMTLTLLAGITGLILIRRRRKLRLANAVQE